MLEAFFGKTYMQLLFVFYSANRELVTQGKLKTSLEPIPMKRDLKIIYNKYSYHNEETTVVISNYKNEMPEYWNNEIILPIYDPEKGTTDFGDDKHMSYLDKYLTGLFAMDNYTGLDVRAKINSIPYEKFIRKMIKKMKID